MLTIDLTTPNLKAPQEAIHRAVIIPPKKNRLEPRLYDKYLYKSRHLIENFFAKLKNYRAIATRYDKLDISFLSGIFLVASTILLK